MLASSLSPSNTLDYYAANELDYTKRELSRGGQWVMHSFMKAVNHSGQAEDNYRGGRIWSAPLDGTERCALYEGQKVLDLRYYTKGTGARDRERRGSCVYERTK